jgi:hypothetical protein
MIAMEGLQAGRDYAWRGVRCVILRGGDIAVRTTPAAGRCVRAGALVTSEGIGGTGGLGGAVPLGDGPGRVMAGPGSGWGAAGSGTMVFPWQAGGPAAASSATAWSAAGRNAATEGGRASGG